MRFGAGQRLRRNDDFCAVREQGRRIDCGAFLLTWCVRPVTATADSAGPARVGVVASRASVGNAVQRNLAKRRLRTLYRQHHALVPAGLDLVLTARPALLRMEFSEISQRFAQACRKLLLLPRPMPESSPRHASIFARLVRGPALAFSGLIWVYQQAVSPALAALNPTCGCRFAPTCSHYAREALREHGFAVGIFLAVRRLAKCGPWHPGGEDPVPVKKFSCVRVGKATPVQS